MTPKFPGASVAVLAWLCLFLGLLTWQVGGQRDAALRSLDSLSARCEASK